MMYNFVIKSKQIWVPPSGGRKGYYREDPREKHILDFLKGLLRKILVAKKKGFLTDEQRTYIHKSLKEVEPRMKYLKTQKQRMAVAGVLKQIRAELKEKVVESEKHQRLDESKNKIGSEVYEGLRQRGFTHQEIMEMGVASAKATYWNKIPRNEALKKGNVDRTLPVRQHTPVYKHIIVKPKVKMGEEEKKRKSTEKRIEKEEENAI
jgi:hypothetical protein